MENSYEVKQVLGSRVTDVIYLVWRYWETVFSVFLFRGVLHHSDDSFDDVIDVGEITLAVTKVEDFDGVALHQLVGEAEVGHVGTTGRTIDGEETETCRRYVVELAVGMCHQFVALFGSGIEGHGIVNLVIGGIWHFLVGAIDAATAGIYQVRHFVMAACFKNVIETDEIGFDIGIGVGDTITDSCLGTKVNNDIRSVCFENIFNGVLVCYGIIKKCPNIASLISVSTCFNFII